MDTQIWNRNASRFFALVDVRGRTECWPWKGVISKHHKTGLFRLIIDGRPNSQVAHYIASYVLHFGPKERRMRIMARCENHLCCNPEHLYATESRAPNKRHLQQSYEDHLLEKFWSKVARAGEDECWLWKGNVSNFGHGIMCRTKDGITSHEGAHRFIYYQAFPNTPKSAHICHHCDVPSCVNLKHLYAGSAVTNVRDRHSRGRNAQGELCGTAKLSKEDVLTIRAFFDANMYNAELLAKRYKVSVGCVESAARRKSWRHI